VFGDKKNEDDYLLKKVGMGSDLGFARQSKNNNP
jgi:hypothetical protein